MDREVTPWRALERMKILRIMPAKKQSIQVDGGENTDVDEDRAAALSRHNFGTTQKKAA